MKPKSNRPPSDRPPSDRPPSDDPTIGRILFPLAIIFHFSFFILHSFAAPPPGDFSASVAHPATWQASAYRGETVAISAQLTGADGKPFPVPEGANASMLWSTNGVDWFEPRPATVTTGGLIRATWTPDMDCGADSYRIFLRVDDGGTSNVNYRANMLLRMLGSPGAVPSELPLPAKTIDFSAVAVLNAPWIETETDPTVPAWAKAENPPLSVESDPVFARWSETNGLPKALPVVNNVQLMPKVYVSGGQWLDFDVNTQTQVLHWAGGPAHATTNISSQISIDVADSLLYALDEGLDYVLETATNYTDDAIAAIDIPDPDYSQSNAELVATIEAVAPAPGDYAAVSNAAMSAVQPGDFPAIESDPVWLSEKTGYATKTEVQSVEASVNLVAMMVQGSNVVAEVTNYNSRVHAPTLRLLQMDSSNEYHQVWAETNGLARVALAATNHADAVSADALAAATNYAAPRAWSRTTSGLGADAPVGYTWMSTPRTVLAGGLEFEKHVTTGGAIWILRSNGMAAQFHAQTNNTAFLDMSSADGTPVFRVEKADSYLVGVDTTSVSVSGDTLVCGVNAVAAEHPLVRVKAALSDPEWAKEEDGIPASLATVSWNGSAGAWVCSVTKTHPGPTIFVTMEYLQEGGTKIINSAPMDVSQGILCTDGVHRVRPVYGNGAVTWEVMQ